MSKEPTILSLPGSEIERLLDPELLEIHIRNKVIKRVCHPTLPIAILNYTQKAQHEQIWDYVTMRCRGLIYATDTGQILAVPFAKFFNYDTGDREETFPENLPTFEPEITKKLDGSLGILWQYGNEWGIATRGSFTSDQAKWATKWLKNKDSELFRGTLAENYRTALFEIIYPENQVVVKYKDEGLILIGCTDNETGQEMKWDQLRELAYYANIPVVEKFDNETIEDLLDKDIENEEGYVATWHHEEGPPLKIKIKFATYFRLHRLLTGTSPKRIWEYLKDGIPLDELSKDVPEHFKKWIDDWWTRFADAYNDIRESAIHKYETVGKYIQDRKTFALWANQTESKKYAPILFKLRDGQRYDDIIWKMVKSLTENLGTFRSVDE